MDLHCEAVLRQRACIGYHAVFWICGHHDRRQRHCGSTCRAAAPTAGVPSGAQRSPEGRLDHRDRQREYRRRRAGVTDQGFPIDLFSGKIRLWDIGIRPGNGSSPPACGFGAVPASGAACPVPCAASFVAGAAVSSILSREDRALEERKNDQPGNARTDSRLFLQPVIEELLIHPTPDNYLDYLRLASHGTKRPRRKSRKIRFQMIANIIFDGKADFTIDGRTSLLKGTVGARTRMGHSHAIYNPTNKPVEFMNINITSIKWHYDAFNLDDARTKVAQKDPVPVFYDHEPG